MLEQILKQGAEAKLYIGNFNGMECLVKERFQKNYRHPDLDRQITKERIRAESKAISRCNAAGIRVPKVFNVDLNSRKIYMEYFPNSVTAKEFINKLAPTDGKEVDETPSEIENLCVKIGGIVGQMHAKNIVHGDLTTSNVLLNQKSENDKDYDLIMIDFGLSHYSQNLEDKGVDLYVLERALVSTHSDFPKLFSIMLESYKKQNEITCQAVIFKFEEVRTRGRKRTMVG